MQLSLPSNNKESTVLPRVGLILQDAKYRFTIGNILQPWIKQYNFIFNPESPCQYYISDSEVYLNKLINGRKVSLNDMQGSIVQGKYLFINPLEQWNTVDTYQVVTKRFISKLLSPQNHYSAGQFTWEIIDPLNETIIADKCLSFLSKADLMAIDIETPGKDLTISCISISAININTWETKTYVFEFNNIHVVRFLRKLVVLPAIKIFQNGQYDLSYLLRFNIIPTNYLLDTLGLFHSWFAELPRKLSFITAFMLRDVEFWKDSASGDRYEFLRYNARDTFGTLHACIAILLEAPDFVFKNYSQTFPLQFPCLLMGMRGLNIDKDKLISLEKDSQELISSSLNKLQLQTGVEDFNPGSPKQVKTLFHILGARELESTDAKATEAFSLKHPLNSRIGLSITNYREASKFHSNYATVDLLNDRLLYSLNPWGTESGRFSSSGSHFNYNANYGTGKVPKYKSYGFQIQNVPPEAKVMIIADPGFVIVELDGSQAESRTTAYLSQDEKMIYAVEKSPDFHSFNASSFFGIPFEELWDIVNSKTKNKPIRDLSKRVNHGANYNMASTVLIATMGEKNMYHAASLLKLPSHWNLKEIAMHLLRGFCTTYPRLKGTGYLEAKNHRAGVIELLKENTYYGEIVEEIGTTNKLVSPLGWTRLCFSNPTLSKPALNKYVAHPSQNLSVALVNRALLRVHSDPLLRDESRFKLCAQVHDSLLCQIKEDEVDLILPHVESLMNETIQVHGRMLAIPFVGEKPKKAWK